MCVTLIATPLWDTQILVYLKLMEVWGRENGGWMFLWLVSNIKILVAASYVVRKCRTDVFVSVFSNVRETMELLYNGGCPRCSAVSLYYLKIPHFSLVREAIVFNNNVRSIYSASSKLYILFVWKISYVPVCRMFLT